MFAAGIAFLRGFQVSLQALGGSAVACQLFLFHRNLSLPASHAQKVGRAPLPWSFPQLLCIFLSVCIHAVKLPTKEFRCSLHKNVLVMNNHAHNLWSVVKMSLYLVCHHPPLATQHLNTGNSCEIHTDVNLKALKIMFVISASCHYKHVLSKFMWRDKMVATRPLWTCSQ